MPSENACKNVLKLDVSNYMPQSIDGKTGAELSGVSKGRKIAFQAAGGINIYELPLDIPFHCLEALPSGSDVRDPANQHQLSPLVSPSNFASAQIIKTGSGSSRTGKLKIVVHANPAASSRSGTIDLRGLGLPEGTAEDAVRVSIEQSAGPEDSERVPRITSFRSHLGESPLTRCESVTLSWGVDRWDWGDRNTYCDKHSDNRDYCTLELREKGSSEVLATKETLRVRRNSFTVRPKASTTYVLTLRNKYGSAAKEVRVRAASSLRFPVISSFRADPSRIAQGESSTLRWTSPSASAGAGKRWYLERKNLSQGAFERFDQAGENNTSNSLTVSPRYAKIYKLTVFDTANLCKAEKEVTVRVTDPRRSPVINSFTANPGSITPGQSSTLSWSLSNAVSFHLRKEGLSSNLTSSGTSYRVSPDADTAYVLTARNSYDEISQKVNVRVTDSRSPVIHSFTANPSSITQGQSSILRWSLSNANSFHLRKEGSSSNLTSSGESYRVSPDTDTTYVLTAVNSHSSRVSRAEVEVSPACGSTREIIIEAVTGSCTGSNPPLSSVTDLNLKNKNIDLLAQGDFSGLSSLEILNLSQNQVVSLNANVFSDLSRLKKLNIGSNALARLDGSFRGLSALKYLYLDNNRLSVLASGLFSGLSSLTTLGLDNNNLSRLPSNLFSGLNSLRYLHLGGSPLTSLPENIFSSLRDLRYLDLSGNNFSSLSAGICSFLTNNNVYVVLNNNQDLNALCRSSSPNMQLRNARAGRSVQTVFAGENRPFVKLPGQPHFVNSRRLNENQDVSYIDSLLHFLLFEEREIMLKLYEDGLSLEYIYLLTQPPL